MSTREMTADELASEAVRRLGAILGETLSRDGTATGEALNEYEAWLRRCLAAREQVAEERKQWTAYLEGRERDLTQEVSSCADELAFWKYQAVYHRAWIHKHNAEPDDSELLRADVELEQIRRDENTERVAHAEPGRGPGET